MLRYFVHITTLILLTLTCSCQGDKYDRQIAQALDRAQALVDTLPDSTLTILHGIDINALHAGKARVHYLTGYAKLRMQNFPDAMWSLLHAEKIADRDDDYAMLALTRLKMMELADSLYDRESKHHYAMATAEAYKMYVDNNDGRTASADSFAIDINEVINHSSSLSLHAGNKTAASGLQSGKFVELLNDNNHWEDSILTDSILLSVSDLHTVMNHLWEKGDDHTAQRLLNHYMHSYGHDSGSSFYTYHSRNSQSNQAQIYVNQIVTHRHIMESFQRETSYAVAKFNYGENLLKDQTLRLHKIHLWLSICLIVVLIAVIILITRLNRAQRLRREEESMHTALELQTALSHTKNRCLNTLSHLCNTYYEGFNRESVKSKAAKEALEAIEEFADSPDFFTYLENRLNMESNGLMTRFRSDMPDLKEIDYRLFLCNALGLSIPTICLLLKEKREVIYNRRLRLRTKIQSSGSDETETFLQYLR